MSSAPHCHHCQASLAADQRYCVACGTAVAPSLPWLQSALAGRRPRQGGAPAVARSRFARLAPLAGRARMRIGASVGAASIGIGIIFGALVSPVANTVAAPFVALGLAPAGPPAASAPALAAAGAPVAPPAAAAGSGTAAAVTTSAAAAASGSGGTSSAPASTDTTSTDTSVTDTTTTNGPVKLPAIKHVWVVALADESFNSLFGVSSPAHYLVGQLVPQGTLLTNYYATGHGALADTIAMVSGQGPTPELQANCPTYENLAPGTVDANGFAHGRGCVFPWNPQTFIGVQSLPDLLTPLHLTWRAYVGGQSGAATAPLAAAADPGRTTSTTSTTGTTGTTGTTETVSSTTTSTDTTSETTTTAITSTVSSLVPPLPGLTSSSTTTAASPSGGSAPSGPCTHPALGASDPSAGAGGQPNGYATRRNPFAYFHSLTDGGACASADVGLDQLGRDLAAGQAATFSWVAPDLCSAGDAAACPPGTKLTGAAAADAWLQQWIPKIMATPAYKRDGMIVIVPDEAPASGAGADSSACCGTLKYANTTNPGGPAKPGPGGGQTGALVLSPLAARRASDATAYDHYSLLRTIEDVLQLGTPLGYAAQRKDFGPTVFPTETSHGASAVATRAGVSRRR